MTRINVFEFQFLIGRLITNCKDWISYYEEKFQFLIGRLITALGNIKKIETIQFQFLIGRLITQQRSWICCGMSRFNSS